MRRKEFSVTDSEEITAFLSQMAYGFLASVGEDGWPHIKPINFVYHEGNVYMHGSKIGEKMNDFKRDNRVTFCVAKELSIIPSYFTDPVLACPASAYFQSVMMAGHVELVDDLTEKAHAFTVFMQKLQPEGGYHAIDPSDKEYAKNLRGTALMKLVPHSVSAKYKLGQNLHPTEFDAVVQGLMDRGQPVDTDTVRLMLQFCPRSERNAL